MELIYSKTGEISKVCIFVATLPASNYRYVEAFLSLELDSWITGHVHAFSLFRSVPRIIPCDNTRIAIIQYCYYESELNPTYTDMVIYYGIAVISTRPERSWHAARAEDYVLFLECRILAPLRNITFFSLVAIRSVIAERLAMINRQRDTADRERRRLCRLNMGTDNGQTRPTAQSLGVILESSRIADPLGSRCRKGTVYASADPGSPANSTCLLLHTALSPVTPISPRGLSLSTACVGRMTQTHG